MAAELIGVGGQTAELKQLYDKQLLTRFRQANVFNRFGLKRSIPPYGGKSIEVRRLEAFSVSTTALTEGTPGTEMNGTWTAIAATVRGNGLLLQAA